MKIKKEHYNLLKSNLTQTLKTDGTSFTTLKANVKGNNKTMAAMWLLLHVSDKAFDGFKGKSFTCTVLYKYLNDTHIDTALMSIAEEIQQELS
jgi:hypothetical protein